MVTRKPVGQDIVQKVPVFPRQGREGETITQVVSDQPFLEGPLLSSEWLRSILIYSRREEFDELVARYYEFLGEVGETEEGLKIDMLPINIVVDGEGHYRLFDQEWEVDWKIDREYLLFRALLTFIVSNWIHMKDFLGWLELYTVRDFVEYGFRNHRLVPAQYFDRFIEMENRFQQRITYQEDDRRVEGLLDTVFDFSSDDRNVYATVNCRSGNEDYVEGQAVEVSYQPGPEYQELVFPVPEGVTALSGIRLDPFDIRKTDQVGFFSVSDIGIVDDRGEYKWRVSGEQQIAEAAGSESCWFEPLKSAGFWLSATDFPKLEFDLSDHRMMIAGAGHSIRLTIRATETPEFILAQQRYLVRARQQEQLEEDLKRTLHHLESARTEIADIKAGKPFRLGMKVFSMLSFLKR